MGKCPGGEVMGLSTAHIPPQLTEWSSSKFVYYENGGLIKAKKSGWKIPQKGGGPRGSVRLFSRQSKKRLMDFMGKLDSRQVPILVTLTYPAEFSHSSRDWKNDLEKFHKRLARKFDQVSMMWKLEPQKRGAPHFHLFLWGVSYRDLKKITACFWYEVVGSGDEKHLKAGTRVEKIRDWRGARSYASKYLGKLLLENDLQEIGWDHPGRFWGVKGRKFLPMAIKNIIAHVGDKAIIQMMRYMRRYARLKGRSYKTLSITVNDPAQWKRLIEPPEEKSHYSPSLLDASARGARLRVPGRAPTFTDLLH